MALYVNGAEVLPTEVLTVNGNNVENFRANGVLVWIRHYGQWSGNSLNGDTSGLETSGQSWRSRYYGTAGGWSTSTASIPFTSYTSTSDYQRIESSSSGMRLGAYNSGWNYGAWVPFSQGSGFSGTSQANFFGNSGYLETSGGLIRYRHTSGGSGAWVSLT